jgi:hypothetical protein
MLFWYALLVCSTGMLYWYALLVCSTGMLYWYALLVCSTGMLFWYALLVCSTGMLYWYALLVCSTGMLYWYALLVCSTGMLFWYALLVCSSGMLYWYALLVCSTGMLFWYALLVCSTGMLFWYALLVCSTGMLFWYAQPGADACPVAWDYPPRRRPRDETSVDSCPPRRPLASASPPPRLRASSPRLASAPPATHPYEFRRRRRRDPRAPPSRVRPRRAVCVAVNNTRAGRRDTRTGGPADEGVAARLAGQRDVHTPLPRGKTGTGPSQPRRPVSATPARLSRAPMPLAHSAAAPLRRSRMQAATRTGPASTGDSDCSAVRSWQVRRGAGRCAVLTRASCVP